MIVTGMSIRCVLGEMEAAMMKIERDLAAVNVTAVPPAEDVATHYTQPAAVIKSCTRHALPTHCRHSNGETYS